MGFQTVGGAPKASSAPPPNGVWTLPDGRIWNGSTYVAPAAASANNQAVSQAYAPGAGANTGSDYGFLGDAAGFVKKAAPTNLKEAGYLLANPIGYGLDTVGIGPDAGIGAKTGGAIGIPGARDVYDPLNLPGVNPVQSSPSPAPAPAPRPGAGGGATSSPLTSPLPAGAAPGPSLTPQIQSMLATYQAGRPTPTIAPTTVGQGQQATAGAAYAPTVGPAQQATAATVTAPTLGPAAQARASQASATDAVTAMIDQANSNQTRAQQEQSISGLQDAAAGRVPSAAELQLRQTRDANVANQLAIAATLQGRSAGGALKQASDASGAINAKAAADAAILRANEQAQARNTLSTALQGVRTADIDVASNQGQIASAANIATAANRTGVSQTNANNATSVSTSNAAQTNQMEQKQGDLSLQAGTTNANNLTGVSEKNAAEQNALTAKQADLASIAGVTNANNATSASNTNANNSTTLVGKQADIDAQRNMNDVINQLKARGLDDEQIRAFIQSMVTSQGQGLQYAAATHATDVTQQLGQGNLALQQAIADWAKTKDVAGLAGSLITGLGSSGFLKNLVGGAAPVAGAPPTYVDTTGGELTGEDPGWEG